MTRKIFWVLWMTVWPIAALVQPLVYAHAARSGTTQFAETPPETKTAPSSESFTRRRPTERLASAHEARTPLLSTVVIGTDPSLDLTEEPTELRTAQKPEALSAPTVKDVTTETGEVLPPALDAPLLSAPSATSRTVPEPAKLSVPAISQVTPKNPNAALAEQEARAQKLIHERALASSLQRQARLEQKYNRPYAQRGPYTSTTRWQPHLQKLNWTTRPRPSK